MTNVELYIAGQRVDLDNAVDILINKQYLDIFDPSKIKNDFTKTVSIPNTKANDELFGNIFSQSRLIPTATTPNIGNNFNPSKKVNFELYKNATRVFAGYVKLLEVKYTSDNSWRYEVALFGELGEFFQKFEGLTVRDLLDNATYRGNRIDFTPNFGAINTVQTPADSTLLNLWRCFDNPLYNRDTLFNTLYTTDFNNTGYVDGDFYRGIFTDDYRNIYVSLVDAENGAPTDDVTYYSADITNQTADSAIAKGEVTKLGAKYTEQQTCAKKEVNQRFGFYMDKLIADIIRALGYSLGNIGGEWVNQDNPYWFRLLCTVPLLKNFTTSFGLTTYNATSGVGIKSGTYSGSYKYRTFSPHALTITPANIGASIGDVVTDKIKVMPITGTTFVEVDVEMKPLIVNSELNPNIFFVDYSKGSHVSGQNTFRISGVPAFATNFTWLPTSTDANIVIEVSYTSYKATGENQRILRIGRLILTGKADPENKAGEYRFRVQAETGKDAYIQIYLATQQVWLNLDDFILTEFSGTKMLFNLYRNITQRVALIYTVIYNEGVALTNDKRPTETGAINDVLYRQTPSSYTVYSAEKIEAGASIRIWDLLPSVGVKEFFLSYIKLFGLYPVIDYDTNTICLLTRNEYYADKNKLDWNDKFCHDKPSAMVPLNFQSKYIRMKYKDAENQLCKNYKERYGQEYNEIRLNTGYDFNNDTYDLLEDIIFSPCAMVQVNSDIFGRNTGTAKKVPALYSGTLTESKPTDELVLLFDNKLQDDNPKSKFVNSDRPDSSMGFFAGDANYINQYFELNGYDFSNYTPFIDQFGRFKLNIRVLQRDSVIGTGRNKYWETATFRHGISGSIEYTIDLGRPREQYYVGRFTAGETTIYERLWRNYLMERYNVNTKIFRGYFWLDANDIANFKFSDFVHFNNRLWAINKIEDYDVKRNAPTMVELISVNNITAYSEGQIL